MCPRSPGLAGEELPGSTSIEGDDASRPSLTLLSSVVVPWIWLTPAGRSQRWPPRRGSPSLACTGGSPSTGSLVAGRRAPQRSHQRPWQLLIAASSGTTASTNQAPSPCAWPADSATSASDEPPPEPTSSCSSKTSRSGSSTPPPASSCASSSSTPPATTNPPADHPDPPRNRQSPDPHSVGPDYADVLRHHMVAGAEFEPATSGHPARADASRPEFAGA